MNVIILNQSIALVDHYSVLKTIDVVCQKRSAADNGGCTRPRTKAINFAILDDAAAPSRTGSAPTYAHSPEVICRYTAILQRHVVCVDDDRPVNIKA